MNTVRSTAARAAFEAQVQYLWAKAKERYALALDDPETDFDSFPFVFASPEEMNVLRRQASDMMYMSVSEHTVVSLLGTRLRSELGEFEVCLRWQRPVARFARRQRGERSHQLVPVALSEQLPTYNID